MDDRKVGKKEHERERSGDRRSSYVHRSHERHTSRSFSPGSDSHLKHSAHMKKEKKRDFPSSHLKRMRKRSRSRSSSGDFRDKHKSRKERCRPRSKNRPKDLRKRKRDDSSSESSDSECTRKHRPKKLKQNYGELKHRHKKRKQVYNSSSSDSTSDSDTSNSDSSLDSYSAECSPIRHKKKSKTSHKLYKKKKKKHKMKSRRKKSSKTDSGKVRSSADAGFEGPHEQHHSPKQVPETQVQPTVLSIGGKTAKARGPMTKEEWEKQQSVVRRVYDPDTGRHRLVKGDGEIIEEIVSREQQKAINKQATLGDGLSFQAVLSKFR